METLVAKWLLVFWLANHSTSYPWPEVRIMDTQHDCRCGEAVSTKPAKGYPYISWQCIAGRYVPVKVRGPNPVRYDREVVRGARAPKRSVKKVRTCSST